MLAKIRLPLDVVGVGVLVVFMKSHISLNCWCNSLPKSLSYEHGGKE